MVYVRRRTMRRKPLAKTRPRRRFMRRRIPVARRTNGVPEWASITETVTLQTTGLAVVPQLVSNVMQRLYNVNLARFSRAVSVAQNYQFYRIKNIKLMFKPLFDTYQAGAAGTVPYLYYLVDKAAQFQNITTVEQLKRMGAVGRRLDDKNIVLNFAPGVQLLTYDNNASSAQFNFVKTSPWLTTNDTAPSTTASWTASGVDHNGCSFCVQQDGGSVPYRVDMQVEFQFKKPYINAAVSAPLEINEIFPDDTPQTLDDLPIPE